MTDPADLAGNAALWDLVNARFSDSQGRRLWAQEQITWGLLAHPEHSLRALGEVRGLDVVELGAGTAHVSAWLARRGARAVAIDISAAQLSTARDLQRRHDVRFPLLRADAEALPLISRSADLVVSEHGAPAWCEPGAWLAEAARILRPGGRLVFLTNSPLSAMCVPADGGPAGDRLLRGPADLVQIRWPGGGVEHHPGHGNWIGHLIRAGFTPERLVELRAGQGTAAPESFYGIVEADWASRWPVEDLWVARRSAW